MSAKSNISVGIFIVIIFATFSISNSISICKQKIAALTKCPSHSCRMPNTHGYIIDWYESQHCSCSPNCHLFGDCCGDVPLPHEISTLEPFQEQILQRRRDTLFANGTFQCTVSYGSRDVCWIPVTIINRCPTRWIHDITRINCEQRKGTFYGWPVVDSRNVMYRNAYCALCNGVEDLTYYSPIVKCSEIFDLDVHNRTSLFQQLLDLTFNYTDGVLEDATGQAVCIVDFHPPSGTTDIVHYCKVHMKKCHPDWGTDSHSECLRQECEMSSDVRYVYSADGMTIYKNMACAQCNHDEKVTCDDKVSRRLYPHLYVVHFTTLDLFSYLCDAGQHEGVAYPTTISYDPSTSTAQVLTMVQASRGELTWVNVSINLRSCSELEVYDPFSDECKRLTFSDVYPMSSGACGGGGGGDGGGPGGSVVTFDIFLLYVFPAVLALILDMA